MKNLKINVVLIETLYPMNIGAASRAISNMGAHRMIMIDRKCELGEATQLAAATGQEAWQNATEYKNWDEFLANEPQGVLVGLTARGGRARSVEPLETAIATIAKHPAIESGEFRDIYLVFGREDHGLNLEDLSHCHFACSLDLFGENTSLNLAQAVLLTLYVYQKAIHADKTPVQNHKDTERKKVSNRLSDKILKDWLEALGFNVEDRKISAYSVLRRVILHNAPTAEELGILEAILEQTVRKLKK